MHRTTLYQSASGVRYTLCQTPHGGNIHVEEYLSHLASLLILCVFDSLGVPLVSFDQFKKQFVCSVHLFSPSNFYLTVK